MQYFNGLFSFKSLRIMKYDFKLLSDYMGENINEISYNTLIPIIEKINLPMRVKIYGVYRDIQGENVDVITHTSWSSTRFITLKIEYGRRFKHIDEYKKGNESMLNMYYRFIVKFIYWFNDHK